MVKNERGLSLVELLVTIGIFSIILSVTLTMMADMLRVQSHLSFRYAVQDLRDSIKTLINHEVPWDNTVSYNGTDQNDTACLKDVANSFECKTAAENTSNDIPNKIRAIVNSSNDLAYDLDIDNGRGFDKNGSACSTYPSIECPIGVRAQWKPMIGAGCTTASCKSPTVTVEVTFEKYQGTGSFPVNIARYNFDLMRPGVPATVNTMCQSIGGTYDNATGLCALPSGDGTGQDPEALCESLNGAFVDGGCSFTNPAVGSCPAGQMMTGINADGTKQCQPVNFVLGSACLPGQKEEGINADGSRVCTDLPDCASGQAISGYDSSGNPICVAAGSGTGTDETPPTGGESPYDSGYSGGGSLLGHDHCVGDNGSYRVEAWVEFWGSPQAGYYGHFRITATDKIGHATYYLSGQNGQCDSGWDTNTMAWTDGNWHTMQSCTLWGQAGSSHMEAGIKFIQLPDPIGSMAKAEVTFVDPTGSTGITEGVKVNCTFNSLF
ncbi:MAG: prepilin-type N-terminal cleavage/methylation domain-containing protein [Bdellovibrionales bacterium]|nr:prepilin-type N-terminal cleavage/methylation domain-containing protein [Bdellovibrionales bacterium]